MHTYLLTKKQKDNIIINEQVKLNCKYKEIKQIPPKRMDYMLKYTKNVNTRIGENKCM